MSITLNPKLDTWFNDKLGYPQYRVSCRRCGRRFHTCKTPKGAYRAGVRNGYDLVTGLCRLCTLETAKEEGRQLLQDPDFTTSAEQMIAGQGRVIYP